MEDNLKNIPKPELREGAVSGSVLLTDVALDKFTKWFYKKYCFNAKNTLSRDKSTIKNAYIIEWFDSVQYYIITPMYGYNFTYLIHVNNPKQNINSQSFEDWRFDSRQDANESGIIKANELYNASKLTANVLLVGDVVD